MPETKTLLVEKQDSHFVSTKLCILLKEYGFNKPCSNFFDTKLMYEWKSAFTINHNQNTKEISQPTHNQVIDWLRETNGIYMSVLPSIEEWATFDMTLVNADKKEKLTKQINCDNYSAALEECIIWALEKYFYQ